MIQKISIIFDVDQQDQFISLLDLEKGSLILNLSATKELLTDLCTDYDLLNFTSLEVTCEARPWRKNGLIIEGHINAAYTQKCVVSLRPVPQIMNTDFSQKYAMVDQRVADKEIEIDPLLEDDPEELEGGKLDLRSFVFELFALELDLYPRLVEAEIDNSYSPADASSEGDTRISPFAVLKSLKDQD